MNKLRATLLLCATISTVFVLALTFSVVTYGSSSAIAHGPISPPDCDGCLLSAHGPISPPDCDGCLLSAHGPISPPDCDGCLLLAHGPISPPDCDGCVIG